MYSKIKEECLRMVNIINKFEDVDKGDMNELSIIYDLCKIDLIKELEKVN